VAFHDAFPILQTTDLPRAVAFYTERFGFEETYRFPDSGPPQFVVVGLDAFSLGLGEVNEIAPAGRIALWLYCEDVDVELEALRQAGVEVVKEPEDREYGERMASVLDPDGNEIYIAQRAPTGRPRG
jgi:lactoylglutathione lyase